MEEVLYVYLIQAGENGPVKIGATTDPRKRLIGLQVGHYEVLRILAIIPDSVAREAQLHEWFKADHIRGEWFRFSDAIQTFAALAILYNQTTPLPPLQIPEPAPSQERYTSKKAFEIERQAIERVLTKTGYVTSAAARELGCSLRTLQYRMRKYKMLHGKRGPIPKKFGRPPPT